MLDENNLKPTEPERQFLNLAYNKFYDIFDEIMDEKFWERDSYFRLSKIRECFSIYSELTHYEPIQYVFDYIGKTRPPMEAKIGKELFIFIRNLLIHFPFFDSWDNFYINKDLVNWAKEGMSMDKFLNEYKDKGEVKYRFWEEGKKLMTYLSINFPKDYKNNSKIYLKDILKEKEGVKFSVIFMKNVLNTQIENP